MFFWKKKKNKEIEEIKDADVSSDELKESLESEKKSNDLIDNGNEDSYVNKKDISPKIEKKKTNKKSTSKKNNKKKSSTPKKNEKRNVYYVSPRKDNKGKKLGWEVKIEGAKKVTAICKTKEEAISKVKKLANNKNGSTIIVKKIDGSHQETIKI